MEEASEAVFHSPFFCCSRRIWFLWLRFWMDGDFIGYAKMGYRQGRNCATFVLVVGDGCVCTLVTGLVGFDLRRACAATVFTGAG